MSTPANFYLLYRSSFSSDARNAEPTANINIIIETTINPTCNIYYAIFFITFKPPLIIPTLVWELTE
jgi:hypothetical protein